MKPADVGRLVLLAAIWGASFLFLRVVSPELGPWITTLGRVGIAGAALWLWFRALGFDPRWREFWKQYLVIGLINSAGPFTLYSFAAIHLPAGLSAILNAASPLFGALFAALWLAEPLTARRAVGLALGFGGVAVVANAGIPDPTPLFGWAVAACLAATVGYAITGVYMRKFAKGVEPRGVAVGSQVGSALLVAPFALADWPAALPGAVVIGNLLALALLSSALAYQLYFRLMHDVGATRALTVTFLIPLFGVAWGALFLGEALSPQTLAGGALVVLGTVFVLRG